jgi:tetratricopeptide (TPR) repeat protein
MDSPLTLFPSVIDSSDDDVERRVNELRAVGLLAGDDADRVRFTHGVVRQVVYADLDLARRRRLHRRVADAFVSGTGEQEAGRLAVIARHLQRARPLADDHEVAAALASAGRRAAQQGALEVARQDLEDALELASTDGELAEIGMALGMVAVAEGDLTGVRQIEEGAARARAEGRWDLVADAAVARAQLAASPGARHALALVADMDEVLEHLPPDDVTRRGLLHSWRGYLLVNIDPERSAAAAAAAEALIDEAASPPIEVATRYTRLRQAEARGDDPEECEREALTLADDALRLGDRSLVSYGHVAAQAARIRGGRFDACRSAQPEYLAASVAGHQHAIELQLVAVDVALAFGTGTVDEIDASSLTLHQRLSESAVASAPTVRFVQQLFVERERGPSAGWEDVLRQVASLPARGNEPILAAGLLGLGDAEAALQHLGPWLEHVEAVPRDWSHDALLALAAEVVTDLDHDGPHVGQLYDGLLPVRGQVVTLTSVVAVLGRVDRYLGRIAHLAGRPDLAIEHLDAARRLDDAAGSGLWSGWAARDEARVRLARDASGDGEAAAELLDLARARARTHGSSRLARAAAHRSSV